MDYLKALKNDREDLEAFFTTRGAVSTSLPDRSYNAVLESLLYNLDRILELLDQLEIADTSAQLFDKLLDKYCS